MKRRAAIYVRGAWAELHNAPENTLESCLAFKHPKPWYSKAYREKRWDGMVRLFERGTNRFPAGLTQRVVDHLHDLDREVFVSGFDDKKSFDLSSLERGWLPGIGLWDHQWDAVHAMLAHKRGVIKSPTGSGKSEMIFTAASFLWETKQWRSLILVPKKGLLNQMYERACEYFDDWITVGMAGDGKRIEGNIVVATGQTLQRWKSTRTKKRGMVPADPWLRELVKTYEVMFLDESHHSSSTMWYDIAMNSGAQRRYGFSGTPLKDIEIEDMKLIGATGPILFDVAADGLIEAGLAAKPKIIMVMSDAVSGPDIEDEVEHEAEQMRERDDKKRKLKRTSKKAPEPNKYRIAYRLGIMQNEQHNAAVVRAAQWMIYHGRKTLLMCRYKEHFDILAALLEESGTEFIGVWGASDNSDRAHAKESLSNGTVKLVLATGIWDEGEDIPGINGIVLAEGVAANTNSRQRIGRGMRADTKDVWVIDFVPTCDDTLREHAAKRADAWEGEGYEVLVWTDWPAHKDAPLDLPFERWDEEVA